MKRKKAAPFAYDAPGDTPESLARALEQADSLTGAPGRDGLLAMAYYRGWGVEADAERAFCHARQGMQAGDGAACYVLALMCANGDTPDQRTGGPRQEYDHYDAEHFMQMAAKTGGPWAVKAHLWLGDYFMDSCRGEDPDEGQEHYQAAADLAGRLDGGK